MPNWVINKVTFTGSKESLKMIKDFVTTEESAFDFQKIIPMPESLNVTSGSDESFAISCAKSFDDGNKEPTKEYEESTWQKSRMTFDQWVELGHKYLDNMKNYHAYDWYDWRINRWGTKWNACDAAWYGDNMVVFDTAWSTPVQIYHTLAMIFPDVEIDVDYADEDLGNNCGTIWCKGEECDVDYKNDFEFACAVHGYDPDELRNEYAEQGE